MSDKFNTSANIEITTMGLGNIRLLLHRPAGGIAWAIVPKEAIEMHLAAARRGGATTKTRMDFGTETHSGERLIVHMSGRDAEKVLDRALELLDERQAM